MTLVLTFASRACVIQVSDRMLSLNKQPVYPASNKAVVFLARDGMLTMSYTGLAQLGSISSDDWLARQVAGVLDWGPPPIPWTIRTRRPQWFDVGRAIEHLTDGLTRMFQHDLPPRIRSLPFEVTAAGWQWKPHGSRCRPQLWTISRNPSGAFRAISRFPRHHYGAGFCFSAMPSNSTLTQGEIASVVERLRTDAAMNAAAIRRLFVDTIRLAASREPHVVGPHCMSVFLYPPRGEVRFVPDEQLLEQRPFPPPFDNPRWQTTLIVGPAPTNDLRESAPANAAYSPWLVVGDDLVVPPTLVQGTAEPFIYSKGQFEFTVGGGVEH